MSNRRGAHWQVYVLRCADGTYYTGITTDLARRLQEHNGRRAGGARYTRARRPVVLHYKESAPDRAAAARREAAVRRLTHTEKRALGARPRRVGRGGRSGVEPEPGAGLFQTNGVA